MNPGSDNPEDGTGARKDFRRGSGRGNPRKTLQLCAQVRRALEVGLTDEAIDPVLLDVRVERVEPTGDDSRFVVLFAVEGDAAQRSRADLLALLERARPVLLREVAATIHRRKLPDLAFQVVLASDSQGPDS